MVIHITVYDLTNCTRSEPFAVSLCGGLWRFCAHRASDTPELTGRAKGRAGSDPSSGTCLPTPRCDVNRLGSGQRGTEAPSNGRPITLANPGHSLFANPQLQHVHRPSQAGALFSSVPRNCHSTSGVLETLDLPINTVHASVLAGGPLSRASCMLCARVTPSSPWAQGALGFSTRLHSGRRPSGQSQLCARAAVTPCSLCVRGTRRFSARLRSGQWP